MKRTFPGREQSNAHPFPPSRRDVFPASATPSPDTVASKSGAFLPSLDTLQTAFLVLYVLNMAGLVAALWLDAPDAALDFAIGMVGAGVAIIATAVVQGRGQ